MLLLIAATFSRYLLVTGSCKGTMTSLQSRKVRLQNTGIYEIYNPQALSNTLTSLRRHSPGPSGYNSVNPCVLKSNYYVKIYNYLILETTSQCENLDYRQGEY